MKSEEPGPTHRGAATLDRMGRRTTLPRGATAARAGGTPPSISDEIMARSDRGKLFAADGRKLRNTERVGAMAPDTDPPEPERSQDESRSTP
jgi:hypothetical protein